MAEFTDLTDTPGSYLSAGSKVVTVTEAEDGLEFKAVSELAGTVDLSEPRYDIDDIADDDVRAIKDEELRRQIYRVTEKIKLILRQHNDTLYGSDLSFGIVGPAGPEGLRGATGPAGSPGANGQDGADGADGSVITYVDGVPMVEDSSRSDKVLSLNRPMLAAGHFGNNAIDMYLKIAGAVPTMDESGHYLPRKATITGIWGKSKSTSSWIFEVRRNGVSSVLESVTITGGKGSEPNLDIDLDADDCLQFYLNGTADFPQAWIEIAWRQ